MTLSISAALNFGMQQLKYVTETPQLEADILLMQVLKVKRSYLHTWPEKLLNENQQQQFFALIERRKQGEPIAYLLGQREFWSLDLIVTPDVLIPRPETELLIELVLKKITHEKAIIADLGTGSGAIALALAHEKPHWIIYATDASRAALEIAKQNAARLKLSNIIFCAGQWCAALPEMKYDAIVSNPPYIAEDDVHLTQGDLRFEPRGALVAANEGLQDIKQIIQEAKTKLKPNGILFLEHGYNQAAKVASIFANAGYTDIKLNQDLSGTDRVTFASWAGF